MPFIERAIQAVKPFTIQKRRLYADCIVDPVCTYHMVDWFGDEETKRIQADQQRVEYVMGISCILAYEPTPDGTKKA